MVRDELKVLIRHRSNDSARDVLCAGAVHQPI